MPKNDPRDVFHELRTENGWFMAGAELCQGKWDQSNTLRFPEIGVPLNHPFLMGFSIINHLFWVITPITMEPSFASGGFFTSGISKSPRRLEPACGGTSRASSVGVAVPLSVGVAGTLRAKQHGGWSKLNPVICV